MVYIMHEHDLTIMPLRALLYHVACSQYLEVMDAVFCIHRRGARPFMFGRPSRHFCKVSMMPISGMPALWLRQSSWHATFWQAAQQQMLSNAWAQCRLMVFVSPSEARATWSEQCRRHYVMLWFRSEATAA